MRAAVYSGTRNLYPHMVAAAKSLAANSSVEKIYFLIEDDKFPEALPPLIETINVSGQTWFPAGGPNMRSQFTYMALVRCCYGKILPKEVDKVLQLDVDTICVDNIDELWDIDMGSKWIIAADEVHNSYWKPYGMQYYNIGVAMFNLAAMRKTYTREETNMADAIIEIEQALKNVARYKQLLQEAPQTELSSMMNALNGGYTMPSSGGDVIANPRALPTGRNLYGVNAETTPTESAWDKGKTLAENTIRMYKEHHHDSLPRKVSFTFWSSEFIETGGTTIAQVLYLLGVEPVRDAFGRVTDIRLIPIKELGRPRIDVVVQTSGQFRDLAASRLYLINRAVQKAAEADDGETTNLVKEGVKESEHALTESGISPKDAREMSTFRIFGGLNGGYGTGIQQMVQQGDSWKSENEIADTYINNMSAFYGSEEYWEKASKVAFKAALTRTDAVIQPRQSNSWGALSLDHVYEFMGGLNLAVRNVTGKDPDAYFADYRNRNNNRMQELKEAIGVESRSTIFNPTYIKEKMKGGANEASEFAEIVQNTYGWDVMKPNAIDNEMWEQIYDTYVKDNMNLGVNKFLREKNPAAMEQMAHTMVQTIQKGLWKTSPETLRELQKLESTLHSEAEARKLQGADVKDTQKDGTVMKKETLSDMPETTNTIVTTSAVLAIVIVAGVVVVFVIRKRRKEEE